MSVVIVALAILLGFALLIRLAMHLILLVSMLLSVLDGGHFPALPLTSLWLAILVGGLGIVLIGLPVLSRGLRHGWFRR